MRSLEKQAEYIGTVCTVQLDRVRRTRSVTVLLRKAMSVPCSLWILEQVSDNNLTH